MNVEIVNQVASLHWGQDITLKNVDEFRGAVTKLTACGLACLILDLSGVSYLNSAALGVIADAVLLVNRQDKQLVIAGVQSTAAEIFAIVRFQTFMSVFATRAEADAYFLRGEG